MGRLRSRLAGTLVVGLMASGLVGIAASGPAAAAGCTVTLTDQSAYTGTDASETVCIAGTSDYTVATAGGDDLVKVTAPANSVNVTLGDGNDAYIGALAVRSTVDAGAGNDKVTTGSGGDTVLGGEGLDRITTKDGADTVVAGDGDDIVNTGAGDDVVDGGPGLDKISGATGDDDLSGGDGADKVNGGPGDDTLNGGGGDDTVAGTDGIDAISGGDGTDKLNGGNGDDGFDGNGFDTATTGRGDAACSNETTLELTCVHGTVVVSVDHTVEQTDAGWRIAVRAHAIDFESIGVTLIKIAQSPTDAGIGAVPTLVDGTPLNGTYEATFNITSAPTSGHFGVRVFTNGFSIDRWYLQMALASPNTWPCITNWTTDVDVDCGQYSGVGSILAGFPKSMRAIEIPGPSSSNLTWSAVSDTLALYEISPTTPFYNEGLGFNTGVIYVPKQTSATDTSFINYGFSRIFSGSIGVGSSLPCFGFSIGGASYPIPWEQAAYTARVYVVVGNATVPSGQSWFMTTLPKRVPNRC